MKGNFHVRFLEESGREIAPSYSANVQNSGAYGLEIRVAANGNGGTFHIESNGVDKTGQITIPNTGGWQTWQTISKTVSLNSGSNNIKIVMDTVGASVKSNLNCRIKSK
jgi:hypothetical protein